MQSDTKNVLKKLRGLNEVTLSQRAIPSIGEIEHFQTQYNIVLPSEYKKFLLECSDVIYSTLQPGLILPLGAYYSLDTIVNNGWNMGVAKDNISFCEDNGDFYCFNKNGELEYWGHAGYSHEKWNSFAHWVGSVWLSG
jgi:hypothetical protein